MSKHSEQLQQLGTGTRAQQEYWLLCYVQTIELFPEITWEMFKDRLVKNTPDGGKSGRLSVEQLFRENAPDSKQKERLAVLDDYCGMREAILADGIHLGVSTYLTPQGAETPPPSNSSVLEPEPANVKIEALPGSARRGEVVIQNLAPRPGSVVTVPGAGSLSKTEFFTDDGEWVAIATAPDQIGVHNSRYAAVVRPTKVDPPPAPINPAHITATIPAAKLQELNELLTSGGNLSDYLTVVAVPVDDKLTFRLCLADASPTFVDAYLHETLPPGSTTATVDPVAELDSRLFSVDGVYTFRLGGRAIVVTVVGN